MLTAARLFRHLVSIEALVIELSTYHGMNIRVFPTRRKNVTVGVFTYNSAITSFLRGLNVSISDAMKVRRFYRARGALAAVVHYGFFYFRGHAELVRVNQEGTKQRRGMSQGFRVPYHFRRRIRSDHTYCIKGLVQIYGSHHYTVEGSDLLGYQPARRKTFSIGVAVGRAQASMFSIRVRFVLTKVFSCAGSFPIVSNRVNLFSFIDGRVCGFYAFRCGLYVRFSLYDKSLLFRYFYLRGGLPRRGFSR